MSQSLLAECDINVESHVLPRPESSQQTAAETQRFVFGYPELGGVAVNGQELLRPDDHASGGLDAAPARMVSDSPELATELIVSKLTSIDQIRSAIPHLAVSERQALMIGAILAMNGKIFTSRGIYERLLGKAATNVVAFSTLMGNLTDSPYGKVLHKDHAQKAIRYTFGTSWYPEAIEPNVHALLNRTLRTIDPKQRGSSGLRAPETQSAPASRSPRARSGSREPSLLDDDSNMDWRERGICAQTDPESFFPEKGGSTKESKRVCLSCDVRKECLDFAIKNDERFGVWGGLTERERRKLKKQMI